jgi:hypothetical protein
LARNDISLASAFSSVPTPVNAALTSPTASPPNFEIKSRKYIVIFSHAAKQIANQAIALPASAKPGQKKNPPFGGLLGAKNAENARQLGTLVS